MMTRRWIVACVLCGMLVGCTNEYSSGDRVLVSKIAYDTPLAEPHRFDVVVFKYPMGPMDNNTPKNYIKRLLGLPGELLAIFFGRVYRWVPQPGEKAPYDDSKEDPLKLHLEKFVHRNQDPAYHWFACAAGQDDANGKFQQFEILRKPPHVMMALRRIVYDNDYQAKDLKGKLDRWAPAPGSGWKADKDTGFATDGKIADRVDWLRYQHLLRPDHGPVAGGIHERPRLITDTMDYNNFKAAPGDFPGAIQDHTPPNPVWVGDLMIECDVEVTEPKGEFWFELSRGVYRYQAHWDLASGNCVLARVGPDGKTEEMAAKTTSVKSAGNYQLRFANIDARLTVWVGRDLPFGDGQEYDPPDIRGPKDKGLSNEEIVARRGPTENDLEPASIGSKGARVKIAHVRVWRDTYYTTSASQTNPDFHAPGGFDQDFWANARRWDPIRKQNFATMYVQPGHYLCLGDNSQASSDSRDWGLVPQRLMLGRALVVYFPIDRMGPIR